MSLEIVRDVSRENPHLLTRNIGRTCYEHTQLLIAKLRSHGHDAYLMCKSPGEGQYTPPGFQRRIVTGLDGKEYVCSGVSHDAIWCDGKQFDTLGSANEHDRPIYRKTDAPFWSFDPTDGPQIVASPVWNEIPQQYWRANNPQLKNGLTQPDSPPPQPPAEIRFPSYAELGDDAFFRTAIGVPLQADMRHAGEALNDGSSVWFSRPTYLLLVAHLKHRLGLGPAPDPAAIVRSVRQEWRDVLTQNHPGLEFPPL